MKKFMLVSIFLLFRGLMSFSEAQDRAREEIIDSTVNTVGTSAGGAKNASIQGLFESDDLNLSNNNGPRLNPQAMSFVKDYIEDHSKELNSMKAWGRPYFNMMDAILIQNGLPVELKYLAVIESRLNASSVSWAGAVGPWQFMPSTAMRMGLKVNRKVDERTNYVKSTHAAAKYLKELYSTFGDWLLVIAAYNGGPGNVQKAIRKSNSTNFWKLQYYLPAESRMHVKKFIGTHYVFEGQGGLTTLTKAEVNEQYGANGLYANARNITAEEQKDIRTQTVSGRYHSVVIAKNILMNIEAFNRFNPGFDKVMASTNNSYELKLPANKMELFNANKYQILNESVQLLLNNTVGFNNNQPAVVTEVRNTTL